MVLLLGGSALQLSSTERRKLGGDGIQRVKCKGVHNKPGLARDMIQKVEQCSQSDCYSAFKIGFLVSVPSYLVLFTSRPTRKNSSWLSR